MITSSIREKNLGWQDLYNRKEVCSCYYSDHSGWCRKTTIQDINFIKDRSRFYNRTGYENIDEKLGCEEKLMTSKIRWITVIFIDCVMGQIGVWRSGFIQRMLVSSSDSRYSSSHHDSEMFEWQKVLFFISLNGVAFKHNGRFQIIEGIGGFIMKERFFFYSF